MLIKPDAIKRGLKDTILRAIEEEGLTIRETRFLQLNEADVLIMQPFLESAEPCLRGQIIESLTGSDVISVLAEGDDAVTRLAGLKRRIRRRYETGDRDSQATISIFNLVHTPDTEEETKRFLAQFF